MVLSNPTQKSWPMPFACAPLLRIASIECFFGFSVLCCCWRRRRYYFSNRLYSMCFVRIGFERMRERQSKGDPNIRVWGVVISNRTDFSVAVAVVCLFRSFVCLFVCLFFCFVLWIRQNTTNPRSGHYNKLNGLCDTHTHTQTDIRNSQQQQQQQNFEFMILVAC